MPIPIAFTRPDQRQVELLAWSDHDLAALSAIDAADVQRAQDYWRTHLPRRFRTLLDATSSASPDVYLLPGSPTVSR